MPTQDRPAPPTTARRPPRRPIILGSIAVLVSAVFVVAAISARGDGEILGTAPTESSVVPTTLAPTTTVALRTELVSRLRDILGIRESAYQKRNTAVLNTIYTADCPCLESDSNAIRELLRERNVWVGGSSKIRVRRLEQVTNRQWIIVATFESESLRIETESGQLVRTEPAGSELFQFVLAKPQESAQWLLGRASSYKDG